MKQYQDNLIINDSKAEISDFLGPRKSTFLTVFYHFNYFSFMTHRSIFSIYFPFQQKLQRFRQQTAKELY